MPAPAMRPADWLMLLTLSVLWGGSFFFVQVAVPALPAFTIVWLRVAGAAVVLALILALGRHSFPRGVRLWGALFVMGFLNNAVPFTLFVFAQGQIASGLAAILNAMTPVFAVIAAQIFTADEKMRPGKVAGVVLGFSGVVVMMGAGALGQAHSTLLAEAACLGAAISYALAGIWGRRFARMGLAPLPTAFGQVLTAAVLLTPVMMLADRPWTLPVPDPHVLLALAALAIVSTAFAYILYFRILASSGATNVLLVTFLVPVSAVCLGVLILGEDLLWRQIAGFALIATGLAAIDGRLPARLFRAARPGSSRSA